MARARNIKPGFYKNEDLAECSVWARLMFPGLWMLADREGRLEDRPKRIKGELFPFDCVEVEPLLCELHVRGFVERYSNDDGLFIQISKFSEHQTPHYSEKQSVIKPPNSENHHPIKPEHFQECASLQEGEFLEDSKKGAASSGSDSGELQEDSKKNQSSRGVETGELQKRNRLNPDSLNHESIKTPLPPSGERFAEFWDFWPANERKQDKAKCFSKWKFLRLDKIADTILADIPIKQQTQKWRDGFIEAPLVYLNGKRWEDGVKPNRTSGNGRHKESTVKAEPDYVRAGFGSAAEAAKAAAKAKEAA